MEIFMRNMASDTAEMEIFTRDMASDAAQMEFCAPNMLSDARGWRFVQVGRSFIATKCFFAGTNSRVRMVRRELV
jgi:hypothetical protein